MATTNSNNKSNLNNVNLSLHEFMGAPWKAAANSKLNPVALEMLLMPEEDKHASSDQDGALLTEKTPFVRRRYDKNNKPTFTQAKALTIKQNYSGHAFKLTYPYIWYVLRASQAIMGATLERLSHTWSHTWALYYKIVYGVSDLVSDFIEFILTPVRHPLDLLFGDEYYRAKRIFYARLAQNRLWLGRSRGYTYVSAFYHRCLYIFSYFRVHKFYEIDLFLRRHLTIRRGLQTILPVGLFCSVVHQAVLTPSVVYSRGLEKTVKKLRPIAFESLEQLIQLDDLCVIDFDTDFLRRDSGVLHRKQTYSVTEFVGGQYAEVEKTRFMDVTHPGEFVRVITTNEQIGVKKKVIYNTPITRIGTYDLGLDEQDQLPDPKPAAPGEEEKDEETLAAEAAQIRASFIPKHRYQILRDVDNHVIEHYKTAQKVRRYREHFAKRRAYKQQLNAKTCVKPVPYVQHVRTPQEKAKRKDTRALLKALPPRDSVATNIPWIREFMRLVKLAQHVLLTDAWPKELDDKCIPLERRVALSPFGMSLDISPPAQAYLGLPSQPKSLRPFSKNEAKVFPYGFRDAGDLMQSLSYSTIPCDEQLSDRIAYVIGEFKEAKAWKDSMLEYIMTSSLYEDEDDEYEDQEDNNAQEQDEDSDNDQDDDEYEHDDEYEEDEDHEDDDDQDKESDQEDDEEGNGPEDDADQDEYDDNDQDDDQDDQDEDNEDEENDEEDEEDQDEYKDQADEEDQEDEYEDQKEDEGNDQKDENHLYVNANGETNFETDAPFIIEGSFEETLDDGKEQTDQTKYTPVWLQHRGALFVNPVKYEPWRSVVWKGLALQLIMYGGIELCIRLECRGVRVRLHPVPTVNRLVQHLGRLPEGVHVGKYIGENMNTLQIRKLLLAIQARRGTELYGESQWNKLWNLVIRPNISAEQAVWFKVSVRKMRNHMLDQWHRQAEEENTPILITRNVSQYVGLSPTYRVNIMPRYFGFNKVTEAMRSYTGTKQKNGTAFPASVLASRQQLFNRFGGEATLTRGFQYGKTIQEEICQFPLVAVVKPGPYRMNRLPKGMILLGDPGNGRTYFVRTLATESRLPLLITESNRYLDQVLGLVRLKTLFKRARNQAPNILFIRDMDFMTRHRERYPMFTSVRATTQLLMAIDGYSQGTETIPSEQDIFVIGSMTTTLMMDEACMRSGRFEWIVNFYYPPMNERHDMLLLHSTKSIVNTSVNVDWNYFTAMTDGFSCLDIRTLLNTSAIYALKQKATLHTTDSIAFALGTVNQVHDVPETMFVEPATISFFSHMDYTQRRENTTAYAPFFTQIGHVPMYKKLMHFFRAMVTSETYTIAASWNCPQPERGFDIEEEPDRTLVSGLVSLLCEGLFVYNTQKMCSDPYPIITFDTYCSPLFFEMKQMLDTVSLEHTLERITKENLFITTFDMWRRAHPNAWTLTALSDSKSIAMRINATGMWRSTRFAKKYAITNGLNELEREILWGPPPIAMKIRNRLTFLAEKDTEFVSRDATLFGTFETHSDLAFKCRKTSTGRRINQVSMEILNVMQKHWRMPTRGQTVNL